MTQDLIQGSDEWRTARIGKVTASRISDVLTKPRKGQKTSAVRDNYLAQIVSEILTGKQREEGVTTWEMRHGIELEPMARTEYELQKDVMVDTVGFVPHPRILRAGASPDGLIGESGLFQIKCPKLATHIRWLRAGIVPPEHRAQMYFEMACTGRKWNEFVSYTDELPADMQLFTERLLRDDALIGEIESEVERFLEEAEEMIRDLKRGKQSLSEQLRASIRKVEQDKLGITEEDIAL